MQWNRDATKTFWLSVMVIKKNYKDPKGGERVRFLVTLLKSSKVLFIYNRVLGFLNQPKSNMKN